MTTAFHLTVVGNELQGTEQKLQNKEYRSKTTTSKECE